jgi:hypothetical protein
VFFVGSGRFSGPDLVGGLGGPGFVIATALPGTIALSVVVALGVAGSFELAAYSYLVWRSAPDRTIPLLSRPAEEDG